MFDVNLIVRENIKRLKPYSSARDEFSGEAKVFLDANENSLGSSLLPSPLRGEGPGVRWNRYPDPHQTKLKQAISTLKTINAANIFLGNGSDECIDLLFRCFCEPGRDNVIINPPTYGMYEVTAAINNIETKKISLLKNFQLNLDEIKKQTDGHTKLIWICSPNNPTGNSIDKKDIEILLDSFKGLIVIDEAYIDFAGQRSFIGELEKYPNLVILQTFSKAWGLASLRLGIAFASKDIVQILDKVKPPYNINGATQQLVLQSVSNASRVKIMAEEIIDERKVLTDLLQKLTIVETIYPSDANFLLVKMQDAKKVQDHLLSQGIVVRDRSNTRLCENCLRITVGTKEENEFLLNVLKRYSGEEVIYQPADDVKEPPVRNARHERNTSETKILIDLNIDGNGTASLNTGLGFFDHMLEQIARHGRIDLTVEAKGDLYIDEHHTIEDVGIALGEAFAKVLSDKRGMERYGFALPMDDAEAKVLIDFGGRSWLVWNAEFKREKIGDMPTEMFFHFFKSFSDAAKCNLNIECKGDNEHHKIEAIFKAFAKAIRMAVKKDPFSNYLPTTKGMI